MTDLDRLLQLHNPYEIRLKINDEEYNTLKSQIEDSLKEHHKFLEQNIDNGEFCGTVLEILHQNNKTLQEKYDNLLETDFHIISNLKQELKSLKEKSQSDAEIVEKIKSPEFLERLSEIEHNQWTEWAYSLISAKEPISQDRLDRWHDYMIDYEKLPDEIKEQDRKYARLIIKELLNKGE
jgi:hypothetical protein